MAPAKQTNEKSQIQKSSRKDCKNTQFNGENSNHNRN